MPRIRTAHKFNARERTGDVLTDELVDFKSLLLSPDVLKGLNSTGFERPSPIQLKAIPLGRCGLDLIAQAKSGTGKTCVFSVIALESVLPERNTTQVLILAPTREIAVQIKDVITAIGSQMESLVCQVFIGGLPVDENKKMLKKPCHIAVGTPGRIKFLIENHFLKTESVRLFILDEADKLLEENFQEQINWIFSSLPSNKQMMAFSATYPEYLAKHLTRYMREPTFVRLNATDPTLQGIKQFHRLVPFHPLPHKTFQEKVSELLKLLSSVPFHQCLVFSNYQIRAQNLCDTLRLKGWPSVFIAGSQTQSQRLKAMEKLKQFKCRVLISTDLTSRGIDAENVNVVVNMDVPWDSETYLHRIGRAGRFGTQGVAVTFVARGEEEKQFRRIEENIGTTMDILPDPIPQSLLGTTGASTVLDSKPTQPRTTSIEVDILKDDTRKEPDELGDQSSSRVQNSSQNCEEDADAANETVCAENQGCYNDNFAEQKSVKIDAKVMPFNLGQQLLKKLPMEFECVDSVNEDVIANVGERLKNSLHLDQNSAEESSSEMRVLQAVERNCDITVKQPQTSAAENLHDANKDSSSDDLQESELKTDHKPSSNFAASENYSADKESLSVLQEGLHSEQRHSCIKETTNGLVDKGVEGHSTQPSYKNEAVHQSDEDNASKSSSESEESYDALEFDGCGTSENASGPEVNFLPPVEEFERDFEEYLANVSNDRVENSVENVLHLLVSELPDDGYIHSESEDALHCINVKDDDNDGGDDDDDDGNDDGYGVGDIGDDDDGVGDDDHDDDNSDGVGDDDHDDDDGNNDDGDDGEDDDDDKTPTEAYTVTQHHNTKPEAYYQMSHQDGTIGYYDEQHIEAQNQTDLDYHENFLSGGSWNYYDHSYTGFCDEYNWLNNNSYNYYSDQGYNSCYSPYHGHRAANWPCYTQGHAHVDTYAEQWLGQYYGDTESYQEYQWNVSWYNAYNRQTNLIRQFVSFNKSARYGYGNNN